ncbi:hypothetical protein BS640_01145 [Rouxiella badensis]|jgi:hypothetical protein|uniref:Uncharacterized protein n=1 Tax=Rouxiella badensis TaxID=1646377 RepID=A0A1X0WL68_9GAMM|nr:hypothetical protein BS640_01145 [Rouxiella badensis]
MNPIIKTSVNSLSAVLNIILAFRRYRNVNIVKSLCFFFETTRAPISSNNGLLHRYGDQFLHEMCQNDAKRDYKFINKISFNKM